LKILIKLIQNKVTEKQKLCYKYQKPENQNMLLMSNFYLIFKHPYPFTVRTCLEDTSSIIFENNQWLITHAWHFKALAAALKAARWQVHHANYFIIDENYCGEKG
jgi:hypothetical protein